MALSVLPLLAGVLTPITSNGSAGRPRSPCDPLAPGGCPSHHMPPLGGGAQRRADGGQRTNPTDICPGPKTAHLYAKKPKSAQRENPTDIGNIASSWPRPRARAPPACAISARHSPALLQGASPFCNLEQLVLDKNCAGRFFKGPGLRGCGSRPQIDRGGRRGVFSSTSQRNTVL